MDYCVLLTTATFTLNANRGIDINIGATRFDEATGTTLTYNGIVAGTAGLAVTSQLGAGTLVLGGINTYSGVTQFRGGTLSISADNNLGTAPVSVTPASLDFLNGGTLATTASFTLSANRGINLRTSVGTFDVAGGTILTYDGIVAGAGWLTDTDTGTLMLGGINTYTGATPISGGTLSIAADSGLVRLPGSVTPGFLTLNGGTLANTATFTLSANRGISLGASGGAFDAAGGTTLTYSGIAAGTG